MENCIFVGCDLHDKSMLLRVATNREKGATRSFVCDGEGRRAMVGYLRGCAKEEGVKRVVFGYEACGKGYGLYDELREAGVECYVLAPTKRPLSVKSRKSKTDEKDAERILEVLRGHVLAGNELPKVWVPDAGLRDDREGVRNRLDVREKEGEIGRQIRSLLKRQGEGKEKGVGKGWTRSYRLWLGEMTAEGSVLGEGGREVLCRLLRQLDWTEGERQRTDVASGSGGAEGGREIGESVPPFRPPDGGKRLPSPPARGDGKRKADVSPGSERHARVRRGAVGVVGRLPGKREDKGL